jgi:hypothetical protein
VATPGQKIVNTTSTSAQPHIDPKANDKKKRITEDENNKEVLANPNDPDKKLKIGSQLDPK